MSYITYNGKLVKVNNKFVNISGPALFDLILTFNDIGTDSPVANTASVSQWNTWFDLPTQGTPFTSATVLGNVVTLSGGSNITLKDSLFGNEASAGPGLLSIVDTGSIVNTGISTFSSAYGGPGCPNLSTAVFPKLTSIGDSAFSSATSLTSFTIPNGVPTIPNAAFAYTALSAIDIPASVTNISSYAFSNCASLANFNVSISNNTYSDLGGVLFNKYQSEVILYPTGKMDLSYTIPVDVSIIKEGAFQSVMVNSISMPNTVSLIESNAFAFSVNLSSINLSTSITSIPNNAFTYCGSLATITIPSSVTSIGYFAFSQTSLENINLPSSLTSLGTYAFSQCQKLSSITLPDSLTRLEGNTFQSCSKLIDVSLGNALTNISNYEFSNCGLTNITIPDSVTLIAANAFSECASLGTVIIGNGCVSIGQYAFYQCTLLKDVSLGNSVKTISSYAFAYTSITNITIPASCTSIGINAYTNISPAPTRYNLYPLSAPSVVSSTFGNYAKPLHIQSSGTSGYNVSPWTSTGKFSSIIQDL